MIYRTRNYIELEALSSEELRNVKYANHLPHELIERSSLLLYDFIDRYFIDEEAQKKLVSELWCFHEVIKAHLYSILDDIDEAKKMLAECQGIEESIEK